MKGPRLLLVLTVMSAIAMLAIRNTAVVRGSGLEKVSFRYDQLRAASSGGTLGQRPAYVQTAPNSSGTAQPPGAAATSEPSERHEKQKLPDADSALPLLSVIGFGVLLGGVVSALRTR